MSKRKRWLVAAGLVLGLAVGPALAETVVIKAVTAFPKNHSNNDAVQFFVDKVNARAGGRL
ncbi:MAG: TRAP transporter substrate-binding protein DctP, partial [Deferrisomatales bacterium]